MNYNLAPGALLMELINRTNGTAFLPGQLTFGSPTPLTGENEVRNTAVVATPAVPTLLLGSVTLRYDRLDLAQLALDRDTAFERGEALMVSDLLPQINARYGVALTPADIVDAPLAPAGAEPVEVVLQAVQASLVWQGSATYQVFESAPS